MPSYWWRYSSTVDAVVLALGCSLGLAVIFKVCQVWEVVVFMATGASLWTYLELRPESSILVLTIVLASLVAPAIQIAYQWERAVVLRFGKFKGLKKSGIFVVIPIIDKVARFVDQRIRVTDFSAETTLTADTVPVNVDAIALLF